jgi:hypothetical protein
LNSDCAFSRRRSLKAMFCAGFLAAAAVAPVLVAGIRGPGRYHGVVFYDRWDNCYLFSGVYLMYVSERVKEALRPYSGRSMEIDAKEVYQPINPGDGLITKFLVLGGSKANPRTQPVAGVLLRASVSSIEGHVRATIEIRDMGPEDISIGADALGFALIAHDKPFFLCPGDGTSCAVITRVSANTPGGENMVDRQTWGWRVDGSDRLPQTIVLRSGEARSTSVFFDLPKGAYQFLAGYGGGVHDGPCTASNAVAFEVAGR